jgi:hypothetical protein
MYYCKFKCVKTTLLVLSVLTFLFGLVVVAFAFIFKKSDMSSMLTEIDSQIT